jgi:hypothetical protein
VQRIAEKESPQGPIPDHQGTAVAKNDCRIRLAAAGFVLNRTTKNKLRLHQQRHPDGATATEGSGREQWTGRILRGGLAGKALIRRSE